MSISNNGPTRDELLDLLLDAFTQACGEYDAKSASYKYDHLCISTWEDIQAILVNEGRINQSECRRT